MNWDGNERREHIRRKADREVCAFHDIKCREIQSNKNTIHEIEGKMATKDDLNHLWDEVKVKAPRWVLILLVGLMITVVGWLIAGMEKRFNQVYILNANQQILLKAFDIQPVRTVNEAEKKLNGKSK
jgi:hypothetical protein